MPNITISFYSPGEENEILYLVKTCFDEFVSVDCNEDGIRFFYQFLIPEEFIKRNQSETFTLVAKTDDGDIIGVIEVKFTGHICLLFVRKQHQGKGIGHRLFISAKEICLENTNDKMKMSVNSSIYAIDIYKKYGFSAVENVKNINGISFLEMVLIAN